MLKVPYGQDAYSVIGKYIRDHITAIEDIIAVIEIDGITTNQLFMVDMNEENYFIWNNDWYEGEKSVALIDFFPVSEAINPSAEPKQKWIPCSERLPDRDECIKNNRLFNVSDGNRSYSEWFDYDKQKFGEPTMAGFRVDYAVTAWMPLPEPYKAERKEE